jgi:hypothetical protein
MKIFFHQDQFEVGIVAIRNDGSVRLYLSKCDTPSFSEVLRPSKIDDAMIAAKRVKAGDSLNESQIHALECAVRQALDDASGIFPGGHVE